jgi:hypothetical protein
MANDIYRMLSKYTHCSYAALMDCIDVYTHDYDWNRYAGFHYTEHNMHELRSTMTATILAFKGWQVPGI